MKRYTSQEIKEFASKQLFDEKVILDKDTSWPRISIVTPSYNQAQFLERTILSVLNQNYPNLEYIIIDGGSNDGSVEIIKKYEKYLKYWVSERDSGQSDAIGKGFQKSTGEILAWINSDDTYLPDTFFKAVKTLKSNPNADLIFGNVYVINEYDYRVSELRFTKLDFSNLVFEGICFTQPATFWTKDIYNKTGGLNSNYQFCMDFDLFIRIAKLGQLEHIREPLANFRIHEDSKTSSILNIHTAEYNEILERHLPPNTGEVYLTYKKNLCRAHRIVQYFLQGDIYYILKKMYKQIKGVTFYEEIKS